MTAIRSNFADLLKPGFRKIFQDKFKEYPPEYTELVNILSSNRQYEEDSSVSGFGTVPEKLEGVGIVYDDPIQGYDKRYTHTTYALGFRVTREMYEDDLYGKMNKMPASLGRSMRISIEQSVADIFNNGFSSSYTGGDGKELFATDHPLTGGGTEQNEPTNDADLNEDSFEQALIDIAATIDDRSLQLSLMPKKLIVTQNNWYQATKILRSNLEPGSGNNAINPAQNMVTPIVNHYLTDTDAWFILCDTHEVNMFFRRRPEFGRESDFNTEDGMFKGTARWSNGWSDFRGVYGSKGV